MNILAVDSCSKILSVSLCKGEEIFTAHTEAGMKHSELVMEYVDSVFKKAGLKPGDLHAVLCMEGPGSFTGLRIGFSVAKGLSLSLSIPFMPVPTLDCIAFPHKNGLALAAVEAGKGKWYFAVYKDGKIAVPAADANLAQIENAISKLETDSKITIAGYSASSLYNELHQDLKKSLICRERSGGFSQELITIAKTTDLLDNYNEAAVCSYPLYIRKTDAELSLEKTGLVK